MARSRRNVVTIVLVFAALFLFIDPFGFFPSRGSINPAGIEADEVQTGVGYIRENHMSPVSYVVDLFSDHDIVFLGEFGRLKQHVEFVHELIPALHEAGVRHLGLQYAAQSDQDRIDTLLTASEYDQEAVEEILFNRLVVWGFQEYAEIFRTAWEVNQDLDPGEEPFRIRALNIQRDYSAIETPEDAEDPDTIRGMLSQGIPDQAMAEEVLTHFVDEGHKALVFSQIEHAFTGYARPQYRDRMAELGFDDAERMGNIVYDRIGDRAVTVYLHGPWPDSESPTQVGYAADGLVDAVIRRLPGEYKVGGFDVAGSPFAEVSIDSGTYAYNREDLSFGDVTDGYVYFGRVTELSAVTPIEGFFNEENIDEAVRNFPGPSPEDAGPRELNRYLSQMADSLERAIDEFN